MLAKGLHRNNECFSPHGFKNDLYFIVAHLYHLMAEITMYILHVAFVSPDGLKNDQYHICSASFRVMALKTTNVTCVARLFRLMAERYFLSLAN